MTNSETFHQHINADFIIALRIGVEVELQAYIVEVLGSHLGRDID
jgi:hypothetical protein